MMRIVLCIAALLLASCGGLDYRAGRARKTIADLKRALASEKDISARWLLAGDYYRHLQKTGTPVLEKGMIHFFYWDEQGLDVPSIVGPFNFWRLGSLPMRRLNGTPLLTGSLPFTPFKDIRYLIAKGPIWRPDPLNRRREVGKTGRVLSLYSPVRRQWPSWAWSRSGAAGTIRIDVLKSRFFKNSRKILWYVPHGLKKGARWRLLVVQSPFREKMLPLYRSIFDNLYRRHGDRNTILVILPVLHPKRELPVRSIDYLDMVKYDLSALLEKRGWSPAGAEERTVVMSGRGGAFLLLSLLKGMRYFPRIVVVKPDDADFSRMIRYFSRFQRPGRLKDSRLLWLNSSGKAEARYSYAVHGLQKQGIGKIEYSTLVKSGRSGIIGKTAALRNRILAVLAWK